MQKIADRTALAISNNQLLSELEERVRQRTAQLEASNKELEAFAYSVSHDLRAPLRAIDGFSQMLQDEFGPKLASESQRLILVIQKNTHKMDLLISDMLFLSRVSRSEVNYSPIKMNELVRGGDSGIRPT